MDSITLFLMLLALAGGFFLIYWFLIVIGYALPKTSYTRTNVDVTSSTVGLWGLHGLVFQTPLMRNKPSVNTSGNLAAAAYSAGYWTLD